MNRSFDNRLGNIYGSPWEGCRCTRPPEKKGLTDVWDHDGKNITADTEIHAVYTALPEIPRTGDNSKLGLWVALLMISGLGIFAPSLIQRSKRV